MDYYNFLTTPSGIYCEVKDILNEDYLVLVKFIESENYKGFFDCLNELVTRDIPNFSDFNIVDKCYVYMAYCMYSIRGVIEVNHTQLKNQQIALSLIINNIEEFYVSKTFDYEIKKGMVLTFGIPTSFTIEDKIPVIDWFSGLQKFNGKDLTNEQKEQLRGLLKSKDLLAIEQEAREVFQMDGDLFQGVPMNEMKMNLCSESLILNCLFFYKYPLEGFYAEMYSCCKHLKMSFSDFMKRSHIEIEMFLSFAKKENEEMSKKDSTGLGRMSQMMEDQ